MWSSGTIGPWLKPGVRHGPYVYKRILAEGRVGQGNGEWGNGYRGLVFNSCRLRLTADNPQNDSVNVHSIATFLAGYRKHAQVGAH